MTSFRLKHFSFILLSVFSIPSLADDDVAGSENIADVTVTARHVGEKNKDLPFMVDSIRGKDIEARHDRTIEETLTQTPGVSVYSLGAGSGMIYKIRGIGALNTVSQDDNSVVLYSNGVPQTTDSTSNATLDIARVEVIKGPQGTLFGRNATAGVLNVVPHEPLLGEKSGHVGGEIGSKGYYMGEAVANIPFGEAYALRAAMRYSREDHPVENIRTGKALSTPKDMNARISFLAKPSASDEILLAYESVRLRDRARVNMMLPGKHPKVSLAPKRDMIRRNADSLAFNWHHDVGFGRISAIAGYGKHSSSMQQAYYDSIMSNYLFGSPQDSSVRMDYGEKRFFSELRLGSRKEDRVFWTAGLNHTRIKRDTDYIQFFNQSPFTPTDPYNSSFKRNFDTTSTAVFGEITYPVLEKLRLTAGLRHTWDKTDYDATWRANPSYAVPGPRFAQEAQSISEHYTTGRIGANLEVTPNANLYAIASLGRKAAGFSDWDTNMVYGQRAAPYESSIVKAYEIGVKTAFPKQRLKAEASLFLNQIEKDHLYVMINPMAGFATTTEMFDTETRGGELSFEWQIVPRLSLFAGLAYVDAKITGVPANSKSMAKSGNKMPDVPKFSYSVGAAYRQPIPDFWGLNAPILKTSLNFQASSTRPGDTENKFYLNRAKNLNMRIALESGLGEVYLWGNNLLNHRYETFGYFIPATPPAFGGTGLSAIMGAVSQGRTFGIGARYEF